MIFTSRCNQQEIRAAFESPFITAILGPRRVGKTTLVDHYVAEHRHFTWVKLNMDELALRNRVALGALESCIEEQAQQVLSADQKVWVAIDEVQKCPEAFNQIKILYDRYKSQNVIKFILTGSALLDLHKNSAETLGGRIQFFRLREFIIREHVQLNHHNLKLPTQSLLDTLLEPSLPKQLTDLFYDLRPLRPQHMAALEEQLVWGGLPEVLELQSSKERLIYLSGYLQTYLEKDIHTVETISDLPLYQNLLQLYAEITGAQRDNNKAAQALGCARNTLVKYTHMMQATLLLKELQPFIYNTLKRLSKSPKIYLVNNGLISYLTSIDATNILVTSGLIGHRFENWFLKELQVWLDRSAMKSDVYFWRLATGVEVDFIVRRGQDILPFEVTYGTKPVLKKIKNLQSFMQEKPDVSYGFYVYNGEYRFDEKNKIFYIPAWTIC